MPRFSYEAYDERGALERGEIAAASREAALAALFRRGRRPVVLDESAATRPLPWWQREVFGSGRIAAGSLALYTRELASLSGAKLPLDETLSILADQPLLPARLRQITERVLERVVEGSSLSDAFAGDGAAFPDYYARLMRAGEAGGSLSEVLDDLASVLERSAETQSRVSSALVYPAILITAAVIAIGVVLTVLLPAVLPLFEEAGAEPPWLIAALAGLRNGLIGNWPFGLAVLALIIAVASSGRRNERLRLMLDGFALRLPVVGGLVERRETGRLARTLSTLVHNGVPIVEAVRISESVLTNRRFRRAVREAGTAIAEGSTLAAPLQRSGLFSALFLRLTAVGEETGQLDVMLRRAASIYETALIRQIERVTALVTPVTTVVIGAVVGGLILTVMSAIVSINDLALQ